MQLALILFALASNQPTTRVLAERQFGARNFHATNAKLLRRPIGISDEDFARTLVETSGLKPWNGKIDAAPPSVKRMGLRGITSGSGPEIVVFFGQSDERKPGRVCQVIRNDGGINNDWISTYNWCALRLGKAGFDRAPSFKTSPLAPPPLPR